MASCRRVWASPPKDTPTRRQSSQKRGGHRTESPWRVQAIPGYRRRRRHRRERRRRLACFEEFAAIEGVEVRTIKNRVAKLRQHRLRKWERGIANTFRAELADGRRVEGMLFAGELIWDDDPRSVRWRESVSSRWTWRRGGFFGKPYAREGGHTGAEAGEKEKRAEGGDRDPGHVLLHRCVDQGFRIIDLDEDDMKRHEVILDERFDTDWWGYTKLGIVLALVAAARAAG